ncbi:MAG TPA: hypothetical protein PLC54_06510, partial [Spirochaetales bacterium]|nr:hypothetical protein [Spirochaetales bacterium]
MYILLALLCLTACSPTAGVPASTQVSISAASHPRVEAISANRADLAELERRGGFASGMGLKEAELSLEDGDGSSYVLALYKEFLYERDYGSPANEWSELRSLADALPQLGFTEPELKRALDVLTVLGYIEAGNWDLAGSLLPDAKPDEPDGMLSWLGA